ncbi:MAG: hypothetical protein ACYDCN_14215 [Bacteroidia bacterium]
MLKLLNRLLQRQKIGRLKKVNDITDGLEMVLTIDDKKRISTIQQEFNAVFPYLKLEFFNHTLAVPPDNPKRNKINSNLTLKQFRNKDRHEKLKIKDNMKVSDLESLFQHLFNISAQVFRKSAGTWIETSMTDDWTLKQQNEEGKELSDFLK